MIDNKGYFFYSGLDSCSLEDNISRKRRNDGEDDANLASRIVNGIAAADNSWPWLARLAFQTQTQHDSNSNNFRMEIIYDLTRDLILVMSHKFSVIKSYDISSKSMRRYCHFKTQDFNSSSLLYQSIQRYCYFQ